MFGSAREGHARRDLPALSEAVSVEREGPDLCHRCQLHVDIAETAARIANAIVEHYRTGLAGERECANSDVNSLLNDKIKGSAE